MALKSGRVGVNPDQVDLHGRLKNITPPDLSAYVKKTEAVGYDDILTQTEAESTYQDLLVSGTNIKTINNESLLGSGNITVGGGGGDLSAYVQKSEAPGYNDILTETEASTTYQTKSGMSSYVLKSEATGYNDILTETEASSTYQPKLVSGTSIKTVNSTSLLGSGNVAVQPTLVSGTNIKTVNSTSLLGSGNVSVQPTLVSGTNIKTVNSTSLLGSGNVAVQETLVSGTNIKTINNSSILGSGNLEVGKYYGIDTTNILATIDNTGSYTATENGYVFWWGTSYDGNLSHNYYYANLDGVQILTISQFGSDKVLCLPIKTGQVFSVTAYNTSSTNKCKTIIYGVL